MAFAVTDFKTQLSAGGGGARPSLYSVDINIPSALGTFSHTTSNILVKAAALPASTIAPLTVNYMGRAYKTPGFRTFDVWNVTILNDEDMAARSQIIKWMMYLGGKLSGERDTTYGGTAATIATPPALTGAEGEATVTQMGKDGTAKQTYKMFQMWPTELGEIGLDWSIDAIEEYTVAFAYDYWSHGEATAPAPTDTGAPAPILFT